MVLFRYEVRTLQFLFKQQVAFSSLFEELEVAECRCI